MPLKSFAFRHSDRIARAAENAPPLARGETSHGVALMQGALIQFGYEMPRSMKNGVPDGIFGDETFARVASFQSKHGLKPDSIAGRMTITAMDDLLAGEQKPPTKRLPRPIPRKPTPKPKTKPDLIPLPKPTFTPPDDPDFMVGAGDPALSHDPGAGAWNSEPTEISTRLLHMGMRDSVFRGAAIIAIGDDAVRHLEHYNRNTGAPLRVNLVGMITEVPSTRELYETLAIMLQTYAQNFPAGSWDITSKRTWGGYNTKAESYNWYFAVGGFSAWIKGRLTVTMVGGVKQYAFDGQYRFYDRYNWDGGKSVTIAGIKITDEAMGKFHRQGLSKEYDEVGTCAVRFQWAHGAPIPPAQLKPVGSRSAAA